METNLNPLDRQVDGDHYVKLEVQPIVVCSVMAETFNYAIATMFKHLLRYPHKGEALLDLEKALHYYELGVNAPYNATSKLPSALRELSNFIFRNKVCDQQMVLLCFALHALSSTAGEAMFSERIRKEINTFITPSPEKGRDTDPNVGRDTDLEFMLEGKLMSEWLDIDSRLAKIVARLDQPRGEIDKDQWALLREQAEVMRQYKLVLQERIFLLRSKQG